MISLRFQLSGAHNFGLFPSVTARLTTEELFNVLGTIAKTNKAYFFYSQQLNEVVDHD